MKIKLLFLAILIVASCSKKTKTNDFGKKVKIDYNKINYVDQDKLKPIDSVKQTFLNTINTNQSPIKVISSTLLKNQYSDHKDFKLIYKNVSKKTVTAIQFEWYCENAFNKPASGKFFFVKGKAQGDTNITVNPGKIKSQIWDDFSTDANNIIAIRAYFVAFSDGTNWKLIH